MQKMGALIAEMTAARFSRRADSPAPSRARAFAKTLDVAGLLTKHAVSELSALSYDPRASEFMDRIQASALALTDDELAHLGTNGFVISERSAFPTFVRGYAAVYSADLPVYISADAILEAVHASYDAVLARTEAESLVGNLTQLLNSTHGRLPELAGQIPASAADLDVYLAVARSLLLGREVAPVAGGDATTIHDLYQLAIEAAGQLSSTLGTLAAMAKNQRQGTPFSVDQMAFVNHAVRIVKEDVTCTTVDAPDGWLAELYFDPQTAINASPTIADVHTQPADEAGNIVGKVLHVATGYPRMMVTTVDTCQGPRAYVGVTFAYHEQITTDYLRLTDEAWQSQIDTKAPANVPWMTPVLGH
jgi:Protein of unknown function (DUF3160)